MAGATHNDPFNAQPYLSPNQQDLLIAALSSNNPDRNRMSYLNDGQVPKRSASNPLQSMQQFPVDNMNNPYFASPQQAAPMTEFGSFGIEDSPYLDYLDVDDSFDFDTTEAGDQMIGSLPGGADQAGMDGEGNDKRKNSEDDYDDDAEGGGKRREGEDKTAKKPGRKPLTSEPTTKRKAQNRAAQRAFRERKEKHLKDLETKVSELEKASESANHENGLLRAQVARLQTELREYRKRLSLNRNGLSGSPPSSGFSSYATGANNLSSANNFQFEFPRFGGLPGSQLLTNGPLSKSTISTPTSANRPSLSNAAPGVLARSDSNGHSISPRSQMSRSGSSTQSINQNGVGNATTNMGAVQQRRSLPNQNNPSDGLPRLFSPSTLNGFGGTSGMDYSFTAATDAEARKNQASTNITNGQSRVFQFNSNSSASNSASPSSSSISQYNGANSSAGTSPEPSHNSPMNRNDKPLDTVNEQGYICRGNSEGEITFCEKLNMACGNPRNPIPRAMSQSNGTLSTAPAATTTTATATTAATAAAALQSPAANVNGIDWLATQNGGQFDPLLFGDYRESQAAIVGDGDFTGGFFNDAFPFQDFASPFNFDAATPAAAAAKPNPMEEIERLQDGLDEEEVVPAADTSKMLSCHKIWDKLQERQDFKDGTFDIDGLCSELRAKARCSESGVVVDQKDVDAALKRLPASRP